MTMGPLERAAVRYAFLAWLLHHAVKWWDPGWFEIPFAAIVLFAVYGLAREMDRQLDSDE